MVPGSPRWAARMPVFSVVWMGRAFLKGRAEQSTAAPERAKFRWEQGWSSWNEPGQSLSGPLADLFRVHLIQF